ncbi:Haloacid dehalogenase-like hydrolase domain-containing protein 3 [Sarcoptes scabiei]|uniref:Haloacid dehalogenase-like hydrolase domain-containing protein 3 n=1 Tax=Sarcoptes scabiei TaxID=52283 RepID=A0A834VE79_SARSC|nr:Haloacid dehalogenase-like hydrolase domain-containing protein 3 [Sarcoptes scabiei]UXI21254.1 TAF5-like RNA polymerase II p300/CBP-associated factor-associated factor [Sarcoptes scabiei]
MFKRIRLISFDITKTLISPSNDIGSEYLKVAQKVGLKPNSPDLSTKLTQSFSKNFTKINKEFPNFGLEMNMTAEQWWSRLVHSTFVDVGYDQLNDRTKLEQISEQLYERYSRGNCWHLHDHVRDLLSKLRKEKPEIILAVASNFDGRLETILRDLDVRHYFNYMFISHECRLAKPDTRFYEHILQTVEIDPKDYLHIGNDLEHDYLPVKRIKANAMLIVNPNDKTQSAMIEKNSDINTEDIISDLNQLQRMIFDDL